MRRQFKLTPFFVEVVPTSLEAGKLYISCRYQTVTHLCACGCGTEINTPLHPTGWKMTYDGESVTLHPSVGNWSEKCRSHYVISRNRVLWGRTLPRRQIKEIRDQRHRDIERYYSERKEARAREDKPKRRWWSLWRRR